MSHNINDSLFIMLMVPTAVAIKKLWFVLPYKKRHDVLEEGISSILGLKSKQADKKQESTSLLHGFFPLNPDGWQGRLFI